MDFKRDNHHAIHSVDRAQQNIALAVACGTKTLLESVPMVVVLAAVAIYHRHHAVPVCRCFAGNLDSRYENRAPAP